jgi:hypothetical protein
VNFLFFNLVLMSASRHYYVQIISHVSLTVRKFETGVCNGVPIFRSCCNFSDTSTGMYTTSGRNRFQGGDVVLGLNF